MECLLGGRSVCLLPLLIIVICGVSSSSAHYIQDSKNETVSSQAEGTCLYNGTWFADKEELPTRGLCLVCRCFPGFAEPNAFSCSVIDCPWDDYHRRFPGCTPIYADRDCCPIGWECDYGTQNPGGQASKGGADCDCEWRYLKHYEAKGCRPVYEEKAGKTEDACTCPWRFDCSQADDLKPDDKVCLFKKHVYPVGSRIPSSNPCESCQCATDYFTQAATIQCATTECPSVYSQTPLPEGCHYVYEQDKCCPDSVQCPTTKKDDIYQVPLCEYKGKMYYEGEQIYPDEDPCLICLCNGNWSGPSGNSCRQHDCMLERDARKLRQGCIPIYHEKTCCPIDYHCADDDFNFKNNRGASFKSDDDEDEMCFFESRYYPIGHVLDIQHPTNCVTCTCKTPPDFTCIHSSCPPPPNNDYANCRAVYKPRSCCPDYTCEEKPAAGPTSCPEPICQGTNCWLVKREEDGCHLCRCKSRCLPCPPMCRPDNPLNECSGCICQITNGSALYDSETSKSEEKPKEESQNNSLQQLIQECKKQECGPDERCMLVETKCDEESCLPVPKCEKVAFGCGQKTCPEGCEEIGSYENNCPLCFCKEQIKEPQYKLTCKVQSCEENCILTGRDNDGCPVCKCPQGNLEERACAESPCSGFNCSMAVNSFGCAECRCQLSCKPRECPAGCELDLDVPPGSGLQCGCHCNNSTTAMEFVQSQSPVEGSGCSPVSCQGLNCSVFEDKSGCPVCSCKAPCPAPECQQGCKVEQDVAEPGRCPGCVCKLSRSARDNTGKECPPPTCLGYNCSVITDGESGCQKCLCESPCEDAPQCPSHCKLEINVPEGRCRGCVCSYGTESSDLKRGGGKVPGEGDEEDEMEPEKREDLDADFIPLPGHEELVPDVYLMHGELGEPLESGLYDHVPEESESRLPEEAREELEEGEEYHDYAEEKSIDEDEDDKCAQKNCPDGQKCVIRRLQCIRTPCPAIPVCIDVEPRCPIPMCAIGCMVMKWDDEVCPSCFCGIIRGAEGRVCPRTRCLGKRCYNVIGDDGCPQCKCDSICIPPKCYDGCFVEKDPPAGKCPTCTCPDRGSVMQPIIPGTTTPDNGSETSEVIRPTTTLPADDIQGRNPVIEAHGAPDPTFMEHDDSVDAVEFYNSLAEIEEEVKNKDLTTVTVNLPTTIDVSDIFDTTTTVSETSGMTFDEDTSAQEETSTVALNMQSDEIPTTKKPCLVKPNATESEEAVEPAIEEIITEKAGGGYEDTIEVHPTVISSEHEPHQRRPQVEEESTKPKPQVVPNAQQSDDLPPQPSPQVFHSSDQDDSMKPILQNLQHLISNLHQVLATHQRPSDSQGEAAKPAKPEDLQESSESEKVQQQQNSTQESSSQTSHKLPDAFLPQPNQQVLPPLMPHQGVNPPYPVYSQYPYANPQALGLMPSQVPFQNHLQSIYANAAQNPLFGGSQQQSYYQQPAFLAPYPGEFGQNSAGGPQKQHVLLTNIPIPPSLQQQLVAGTQTLGFLQHLLNHRNNPFYQQQLVNLQQQHLNSQTEQKDPVDQQVVYSSHQPPQQQQQQQLEQASSTTEQPSSEVDATTTPQPMPEFPVVLEDSDLASSSQEQHQVVQVAPGVDGVDIQFNHHAPQQQNTITVQSNTVENSQEQQLTSQQDQLEALAQQYQQLQEQMNQVQASQQQGYISTDVSSQERPVEQDNRLEQPTVQFVQEQPSAVDEIVSSQELPSSQAGSVINFGSQQQQVNQVLSSAYEKPVEQPQNELHISDKPILQAQPGYQSVFSNHNIQVQQTNQPQLQQNINNIDDTNRPVLQGQTNFEASISQENNAQQTFQQTLVQQAPSQFLNQQAQQQTEQQFLNQQAQQQTEQQFQVSQTKPEQFQDNIQPIVVSLEQTSQPAQQTFQSQTGIGGNQQQYIPFERPVYQQVQQPAIVPNAQQAYQPVTISDPSGITSPFSNQVPQQQAFLNQNINQQQQVYQPLIQAQPVVQDKDQSGQQHVIPQNTLVHQHSQVQYVSNENEIPSPVTSGEMLNTQQQFQYKPIAEQQNVPQQQYLQQQSSLPFAQQGDLNVQSTPLVHQQQQQYLGVQAQQGDLNVQNTPLVHQQQQQYLGVQAQQGDLNVQNTPLVPQQQQQYLGVQAQQGDLNVQNTPLVHQQQQQYLGVQAQQGDLKVQNPPLVPQQQQQYLSVQAQQGDLNVQNTPLVPQQQQQYLGVQAQQGDLKVQNTPLVHQQQQYLGVQAQQPAQVFDNSQTQQYQQQFINPSPVQQPQAQQQQLFIAQEKPIIPAYQPPVQPDQPIPPPIQQQYQQSNYNQQQYINQQQQYINQQQQYINQQQQYQPQQQQFANQQTYYNPHHTYNQQQQQYIQQQYYNPNQRPTVDPQQFNQQQQYLGQAPSTFQQYQQQFMSNQQQPVQQTYQQQQQQNEPPQIQANQAYIPPQSDEEDPSAYIEDNAAQQDHFQQNAAQQDHFEDNAAQQDHLDQNAAQQDHFEKDLQQQTTSQVDEEEDSLQQHIEDQVMVEPHFGDDTPQEEEHPLEEKEHHQEEQDYPTQQDVYQEHVDDNKFSALEPLAQVVTGATTDHESVLGSASVQQVVENLRRNDTIEEQQQQQTTPLEPIHQASHGVKSRPGVIYRPHFTTPSPTTLPPPEPTHDLFPAPSRPLNTKPALQQEDYVLDQQQFVQEDDSPLDDEFDDYDDFDLPESTTLSPPTPTQEVLQNFDNHQPDSVSSRPTQQFFQQEYHHQTTEQQYHHQQVVDDPTKPPVFPAVSPTAEAYAAVANKHPYQCPTPHCNGYNCSLIRGADGCQKCVCDSPCAPCPQHCVKTKTVNEGRCPVCDCTGAPPAALSAPTRQCPAVECQGSNCRKVKNAEGCMTCICDPKCVEPQCDPGCEVLRDVPPGQCPGCVCRVTVVQAVVAQRQRPCKAVSCGSNCNQTNGPDGCPTCVCPPGKAPCPAPQCDPGCRVENNVGTCPTCVCSSAYLDDEEDDDDDDDDLYCPNLFCSEYGCREVPGPAGCPICMCDPVCKTPVCDPGCKVVSNQFHGRCPVCICSKPAVNDTQQHQHQHEQNQQQQQQHTEDSIKTVHQQQQQHQQESVTFSGLAIEAVVAEEEEEEETEASTLHTTVTVPFMETTTLSPTCPPPVCSGLRCATEMGEDGCEVCKCRYKCPTPKCVGKCYPETNAPSHRCPGCVCPKSSKPPKY